MYQRGLLTEEMEIVSICHEMHWTYWDYMLQPSWFLNLFKTKLRIDNERMKKELQKINRNRQHAN